MSRTARLKAWIGRRLRSRWIWFVLILIGLASPELYAWQHFRAGRKALETDHPEEARDHLRRCRSIWPWDDRVENHLLSSRAARQSGDLPAAMAELRDARRLAGSTTPELAFEWALLQAADGNVAEVAEYLQQQADANPTLQRLVWEALGEGYLAVYRANDAYTIAQRWTQRYPDDLRALELRGFAAIQNRGRGLKLGAEDLNEVLRRDPARTRSRIALSTALLELGQFAEAVPELERLVRERPAEPDYRVRLARSLKMIDRGAEAEKLLDDVLREHPDHGTALRTRGQFALADLRQAEAERWLKRAAEVLPNDYQTQYLYYQALVQSGHTADAAEQLKRSELVKVQMTQLSDLRTRRMAERPLDPALYTELGILLLATGKIDEAVRWLEVAISLDPGFRSAHEALGNHYEKSGNAERAAYHRRLASISGR